VLLSRPADLPEATSLDRLRGTQASGTPLVLRDGLAHAEPIATREPGVRLYWTASLDASSEPIGEE
jgi:hypothetical protein